MARHQNDGGLKVMPDPKADSMIAKKPDKSQVVQIRFFRKGLPGLRFLPLPIKERRKENT